MRRRSSIRDYMKAFKARYKFNICTSARLKCYENINETYVSLSSEYSKYRKLSFKFHISFESTKFIIHIIKGIIVHNYNTRATE